MMSGGIRVQRSVLSISKEGGGGERGGLLRIQALIEAGIINSSNSNPG